MLTLGGEPLLIPDAGGELDAWLRQYLDVADASLFFPPPAVQSDRNALRTRPEAEKGIGLPILNYPLPPRPRLNSLHWPTGAARWGFGLFLADDETKKKLVALGHSSASSSLELKWGDTDKPALALSTRVHMLEPRPVTGVVLSHETAGKETLWLIPVVDHRYWWQFAPVELEVTEGSTWSGVFGTIGGAILANVDPGVIDGRFFSPSEIDLTRRWDNGAVLLDAAAWSVGKRVVRTLAGAVILQDHAEAEIYHADNVGNLPPIVAGGRYDSAAAGLPEAIMVTFRQADEGQVVPDAEVWNVVRQLAVTAPGPGFVTVHSSMLADMTDGPAVPHNECRLECLTEALRDAIIGWATRKHDFTAVGAIDWSISGFDNLVTWEVGRPQGGDRLFQTRVQSYPPNFLAEQQLSEDPDTPQEEGEAETTTTQPPPSGCYGRCKWTWSDSGQYWALDTDDCTPRSATTTTSTTTTTTTSTTPNPDCDCSQLEEPPDSGTTTTTTTAEPECRCLYPDFCGSEDGDCTYTQCSDGYYTSNTVECTTTTTTTTTDPGTTTTTPDCSTTTTTAECTGNCDWVYTPQGWVQKTNPCTGGCSCASPSLADAIYCQETTTPCVQSDPPAVACGGACVWFGVPSLETWYLIEDNCTSNLGCHCLPPSFAPEECQAASFPCIQPTTTTPDPCAGSTTTSTSTTSECGGYCEYSWDGAAWNLEAIMCGSGACLCNEPVWSGQDTCEHIRTSCGPGPLTTTTTTTTTTTSALCGAGQCYYACVDGIWQLVYYVCAEGAGCGCDSETTIYPPPNAVDPDPIQISVCGPCSYPNGTYFIKQGCSEDPEFTGESGEQPEVVLATSQATCTTTTTTTGVPPG